MAKTVLVIDDHLNVRNILKFNLQRRGYNVLTAEDGESGMQLILKEKIDLTLLDIMLPGIDGFKILDTLKAGGQLEKTPIMIISAKGEETDILTALKKGARDYIVKPFNFEVLFNKINRLIHTQPGEQPAEEQKPDTVKAPIQTLGRNFKSYMVLQIIGDFEESEAIKLEENVIHLAQAGWGNMLIDFKPGLKVKTVALGKLVKLQQEISKLGGTVQLIVRDNDIMTHIREANFAKYFTIFKNYDEAINQVAKEPGT